ncbi:MAG: AAA family ATPase [Elusimicrobiota bacterium]
MLNRLEVQGFKSIKKLNLKLDSLNVLIGANGVGKSNLMSLFSLLYQLAKRNFQVHIGRSGGADSLLYFGRKTTNELLVTVSLKEIDYEIVCTPTLDNLLIFSKENMVLRSPIRKTRLSVSLGKGHRETNIEKGISRNGVKQLINVLLGLKVYHFNDTSASSKMKQLNNVNDNVFLKTDASNIASFIFLLRQKHPKHYNNIVDTIQMVAPFFDDFILRNNPFDNQQIQLEWKEKGSDAYFNAHSFSDGTLRFICLATLLLQPNLPSVVLLDEPELGLHPSAITILAGLLKSASTKTQVIVSTQSVTLVNQFKPENIIVVDRDESQSTFKRLSQNDTNLWLEEYGLGDLWEKNIIGGRP